MEKNFKPLVLKFQTYFISVTSLKYDVLYVTIRDRKRLGAFRTVTKKEKSIFYLRKFKKVARGGAVG